MANTELILGLAGIAGTALTGFSGIRATLSVESRRARREDALATKRLRAVLRLVRSDLESAAIKFETAIERRQLWLESEPLTAGHLDAHREQLAAELDDPRAWTALQSANMTIDKVVTVMAQFQSDNLGERIPVEGPFVELLQMAAQACADAADALLQAEASLPRRR